MNLNQKIHAGIRDALERRIIELQRELGELKLERDELRSKLQRTTDELKMKLDVAHQELARWIERMKKLEAINLRAARVLLGEE